MNKGKDYLHESRSLTDDLQQLEVDSLCFRIVCRILIEELFHIGSRGHCFHVWAVEDHRHSRDLLAQHSRRSSTKADKAGTKATSAFSRQQTAVQGAEI